jgi:hypothetical protein
MIGQWSKRRVLIAVRTYPVPATKGIEVSCTAAITDDGQWMRLFPVPYRFLDNDKRFHKWQWIDVSVIKASDDPRPESFKLNDASIEIVSNVPTTDGWRARKELVYPLRRPSLCSIQQEQKERRFPTLGIFKPGTIKKLVIEPTTPEWTAKEAALLKQHGQQALAIGNRPARPLEKLPFNFRYIFRCDDGSCKGHEMTCFDWEMAQSYRSWRRDYGESWQEKFRQKYETEMKERFDTHFFVGTMHQHPDTWIIVGLFYPPRSTAVDLFDQNGLFNR